VCILKNFLFIFDILKTIVCVCMNCDYLNKLLCIMWGCVCVWGIGEEKNKRKKSSLENNLRTKKCVCVFPIINVMLCVCVSVCVFLSLVF
jgi:hypothetical protein